MSECHCKGCSHPTICRTHGCAVDEATQNKSPVAPDPESVRRGLLSLAQRDVITDRDRILIGAAISLIRKPAATCAATMTDTDIIRMAREAGFMTGTRDYANGEGSLPFVMPIGTSTCLPELARFAALVAEATKQEGEPHA